MQLDQISLQIFAGRIICIHQHYYTPINRKAAVAFEGCRKKVKKPSLFWIRPTVRMLRELAFALMRMDTVILVFNQTKVIIQNDANRWLIRSAFHQNLEKLHGLPLPK